jgi:hypothetical protein
LLAVLAVLIGFGLTGCESYSLQGVVVEGKSSQVLVVDKNDSRLGMPGLRDARIDVTIDPRTINPRKQAVLTVEDGRFSMPINESGAGFLEYEAAMVIQHEGFVHIEHTMKLPGNNKRVLIIMKPGDDHYKPETNVVDESVREGQRLDMLPRN